MRPLLTRPLVRFLQTESAGGVLLVVAGVLALVWANGPARAGYEPFWQTDVALGLDVRHVVNDGLMALFFLVVSLEIKREVVVGELHDRRVAALPAIAAIGGVLVPAAIYAVLNVGRPGSGGWGIPMATDIAFAVGVLALLGPRVPPALKVFLLALAIVDDVIAIVVIAVFYAADVDPVALALAGAAVAASVVLRRFGVHWPVVHVLLGLACWWAVHESGVHATVAGVAFGIVTPVRRGQRLEDLLHPVTGFVIVPLFALANAGVELRAGALDAPGAGAVAAGVVGGLVVGKLVGVTGATWLAVRTGLASLPAGVGWAALAGAAGLAGIGFTVSLFVAGLAFEDDRPLRDAATLGVLVASVTASLVGSAILLLQNRQRVGEPAKSPARTPKAQDGSSR